MLRRMDGDGKPPKRKELNGFVLFAIHIAVVVAIAGVVTYFRKPVKRWDNTVCADGTRTISSGQGACSHHGGIRGYLR